MSARDYDSRTADKFVARLPEGLRAEIEAVAVADDRSMNSVFVQAVRQYLDGQKRQQFLLDALTSAVTTPFRGSEYAPTPTRFDTQVPAGILEPVHIDDRVQMAQDAARYRWLRDGALGTGSAAVPMVRVGLGDPVGGADLDHHVDQQRRNWPLDAEDEA